MRWDNLDDPLEVREARKTRALEGQSPLGNSSITRGGLRIASEEGLRVEGSILGVANNDLGLPALIDWRGTAKFTGDVSAEKFSVSTAQARMLLDAGGFSISRRLGPNEWEIASLMITPDLLRFRGGEMYLTGVPQQSSRDGMRALAIDSNGRVHSVPFPVPSTGGGEGTPWNGQWPASPYSYAAFFYNNWDGEADYGERTLGKGWHDGIDYAGEDAWAGSPVKSIGAGVTVDPSYASGWGGPYPVIVQHSPITSGSLAGKTLYSVYAHMASRTVGTGVTVEAGQVLGTLGAEGQVTGAHLHLELHIDAVHMYGTPGVSGSQDPVPIFNEYGGWP